MRPSESNPSRRRASSAAAMMAIKSAATTSTAAASSASVVDRHAWTICRSAHDDGSHRRPSPIEGAPHDARNVDDIVPPSSWDEDARRGRCFLRRNEAASAPGTALFQHWLSDYGEGESSTEVDWDPRSDFPTWEVMSHYPDIGEGKEAREYYTLWYTTVLDRPDESSVDKVVTKNGDVKTDERRRRRRRGHLTLHGANYMPVVYFDGKLVLPYSTTPNDDDGDDLKEENAGGMFLRRHYDLGVWNDDEEEEDDGPSSYPLDILVLPPPFVGRPTPLNSPEVNRTYGLVKGQGGDHNLARSGAVMQFTTGWDWIQSTPDRNVGIWDGVDVEWVEGDVRLHDLYAKVVNISLEEGVEGTGDHAEGSALPLGDGVIVSAWLDLSITATCHQSGLDGRYPVRGVFEYWITPSSPSKDSATILASGTIQNVTLHGSAATHHLGQVLLTDARLWWPHPYSTRERQPLYSVHVAFRSYGTGEANSSYHESQARTNIGIRTISSFVHPQTKSFALKVNGHPIFLAGGNWIATDQFLRYSDSPQRYLQELSMLRHAGFSSVRVWGGGVAETSHFYDSADALGLLVYQEFWMTGDLNGRFAGSYDWPNDHDSYLANARDVIKRLRNHPSLCWYGGGNELLPIPSSSPPSSFDAKNEGSDVASPPKDIEKGLRRYMAELDGTRPYITSSVTDAGSAFDNSRTLAPKDGPYGMMFEKVFFDQNPGFTSPLLSEDEMKRNVKPSDVQDKDSPGRNIGFQTEVGSVSHPELESLERFLSRDALDAYPDCGEKAEYGGSIHDEWAYFKYSPFTENSSGLDHICQFKFPPHENDNSSDHRMDSIEEYTWAAQFAQYFQYKSLMEGYTYRMWEWYSAVFIWKTSSPAPTFRGALYDWYLATNGGYWGARAGLAGGSPVRVILNLRDWTVHVVNMVPTAISATSVEWSAYSLGGELLANGEIPIPDEHINGNSVAHLEESFPWVDMSESFMSNQHELQNIVLYRLELSYVQHDDVGTTNTAKNIYYLTDPSIGSDDQAQSRFSLLGAIRKEAPSVNLNVRCQMSTSGVECQLQNAYENTVAVMIKLALVKSLPNNPSKQKNPRILPMLFSDNYLTMLPGETLHVNLSIESIELLEQSILWKCSTDGFLGLMLSVDGWNIQKREVQISCVEPSSGASLTESISSS